MTKAELLAKLSINQKQLAARFDITPAAVSLWPDDAPIPKLRLLELPERFPELFRKRPKRRRQKRAVA